jgi:hypothetical protein
MVEGGLDPEVGLDRGALLLDGGGVAEAVDHHIGALLGHGAGDGQADAAGGAGDEGGLGLEGHDEVSDQAR